MDVELTVGFMSFQETYVSKVACRPYESVEVCCAILRRQRRRMLTSCAGRRRLLHAAFQVPQHHLALPAGVEAVATPGLPVSGCAESGVYRRDC